MSLGPALSVLCLLAGVMFAATLLIQSRHGAWWQKWDPFKWDEDEGKPDRWRWK